MQFASQVGCVRTKDRSSDHTTNPQIELGLVPACNSDLYGNRFLW